MSGSSEEKAGPEPTVEIASPRNTRNGLLLFAVYLTLYASFVLLNAFVPSFMEGDLLEGINWAVAYGLGLIVGALFLALVYAWLCRASWTACAREDRR